MIMKTYKGPNIDKISLSYQDIFSITAKINYLFFLASLLEQCNTNLFNVDMYVIRKIGVYKDLTKDQMLTRYHLLFSIGCIIC